MGKKYPHPYVWRKVKESGAYMKSGAFSSENIFPEDYEDIYPKRQFSKPVKVDIGGDIPRTYVKIIEKEVKQDFLQEKPGLERKNKQSIRERMAKFFRSFLWRNNRK